MPRVLGVAPRRRSMGHAGALGRRRLGASHAAAARPADRGAQFAAAASALAPNVWHRRSEAARRVGPGGTAAERVYEDGVACATTLQVYDRRQRRRIDQHLHPHDQLPEHVSIRRCPRHAHVPRTKKRAEAHRRGQGPWMKMSCTPSPAAWHGRRIPMQSSMPMQSSKLLLKSRA